MMRRIAGLMVLCLVGLAQTGGHDAKRPEMSGVAFVRISVSDLKTAALFYNGTLRLPNMQCSENSAKCFFVNPSQQVELSEQTATPSGDRVVAIGIFTKDVDSLRQYLLANGQKPDELVTNKLRGISFQIKDPEGRVLEFVQRTGGVAGSIAGPLSQDMRIIHSGFVVKDRGAVDKFYRDVLGFHVYWHGGMKDGETDWVDMQVPDGTDWIEYMLNVPANADKHTLGVMNHIALGVPDVRAAAEQLKKNGVNLAEEPKIGRDGKWQLNLYDPDLTRVELMGFTPAEKPCCAEYTGAHPKP
jgi:catechol 2,3-dioxygenase-like lactoylglutathione lyase family enzyme/predicted lactoylglutathione lyase